MVKEEKCATKGSHTHSRENICYLSLMIVNDINKRPSREKERVRNCFLLNLDQKLPSHTGYRKEESGMSSQGNSLLLFANFLITR